MKTSIKNSIRILCVLMVVIAYITTIILSADTIDIEKIMSIKNIFILIVLVLIAFVSGTILARMIDVPLRKLEKAMHSVAEGKMADADHVKEYTNMAEITEFVDCYTLMMERIKKNNFDLNSQQSKTEIILEHIADGVVAFSISKQVVHMNKSAMRLLNIDLTDDTFSKIIKKLNIDLDFDKIMYLQNFQSVDAKTVVDENTLNIVFIPFFSDRLTPMGVIMMVRNITETVKLDNMRKEFVANVSHELKTPLTSIKGYSETMMTGDLTFQEIMRFSKVINQEANRMDRLVADLLQLSRFDSKRTNWKKMVFSLEDLVNDVCLKMKYAAEEKHHRLDYIMGSNIPSVYADKDSIEQVIMNVLSNSIKYTHDNGIIQVFVENNQGVACVRVVDNGIGIPPEDLKRIFERFYRVDKARSRKMGGTGLGLSIVKEIIDANQGDIKINSVINQGTEVIITLPNKVSTTYQGSKI